MSNFPAWLDRTAYPFPVRRFETSDGGLSYVDVGEGPVVVLVHGTPSWSFEWRHVIADLARDHRVLAPDHLGFGLSDDLGSADGTPRAHGERLLAWFDAMDLREVSLVLHDFGGPIGLPIALERSARVKRVAMVNTWAWPLGDREDTARLSKLVASPIGYVLYHWFNGSPRWIVPSTFADRSKLTPLAHKHYMAPFRPARRAAARRLGVELVGSDEYYAELRDRLSLLLEKEPLLIWGTEDPAFGMAELEQWRKALPAAKAWELPVGHFPQEEAPSEVSRALREW